ncbi:MAG TPA: flagellar biosynthetic protein FliO, partial [Casimicrobiaceae bacterium]
AGAAIRIIATQALGQRERVVLVEIADQWLVLGVAPGQVSALSTLPKGTLPPRMEATSPFAALLARARAARGGGGDAGTADRP